MHQVTIRITVKVPAMHLSRRHEIYLVRLYVKTGKINGMRTGSLREQYQVVERVAVLAVQVFVLPHIRPET